MKPTQKRKNFYENNVVKKLHKKLYQLTVRGKTYGTEQAAEILKIPEKVLLHGCRSRRNGKDFNTWVKEAQWKVKNNVSLNQKIVICEGIWVCTDIVMKATNACIATARNRLRKVRDGKMSYVQLMEPITDTKKRIGQKAAKALHDNRERKMDHIPGIQPRRSVSDMRPLGTFERGLI